MHLSPELNQPQWTETHLLLRADSLPRENQYAILKNVLKVSIGPLLGMYHTGYAKWYSIVYVRVPHILSSDKASLLQV